MENPELSNGYFTSSFPPPTNVNFDQENDFLSFTPSLNHEFSIPNEIPNHDFGFVSFGDIPLQSNSTFDGEFIDAETFLEEQDNMTSSYEDFSRDSFAQETANHRFIPDDQEERGSVGALESDDGRPSAFFERKSCNMEKVRFMTTTQGNDNVASPPSSKYSPPHSFQSLQSLQSSYTRDPEKKYSLPLHESYGANSIDLATPACETDSIETPVRYREEARKFLESAKQRYSLATSYNIPERNESSGYQDDWSDPDPESAPIQAMQKAPKVIQQACRKIDEILDSRVSFEDQDGEERDERLREFEKKQKQETDEAVESIKQAIQNMSMELNSNYDQNPLTWNDSFREQESNEGEQNTQDPNERMQAPKDPHERLQTSPVAHERQQSSHDPQKRQQSSHDPQIRQQTSQDLQLRHQINTDPHEILQIPREPHERQTNQEPQEILQTPREPLVRLHNKQDPHEKLQTTQDPHDRLQTTQDLHIRQQSSQDPQSKHRTSPGSRKTQDPYARYRASPDPHKPQDPYARLKTSPNPQNTQDPYIHRDSQDSQSSQDQYSRHRASPDLQSARDPYRRQQTSPGSHLKKQTLQKLNDTQFSLNENNHYPSEQPQIEEQEKHLSVNSWTTNLENEENDRHMSSISLVNEENMQSSIEENDEHENDIDSVYSVATMEVGRNIYDPLAVPEQIPTINRTILSTQSTPSVAPVPTFAALPSTARRVRRLLSCVGDVIPTEVSFLNTSTIVRRICLFLVPLSTGCQQFSVIPGVLEVPPGITKSFTILFSAQQTGAVIGLFQFRCIGTKELLPPYEIRLEAAVRDRLPIDKNNSNWKQTLATLRSTKQIESNITEIPPSSRQPIDIRPTWVHFNANQVPVIHSGNPSYEQTIQIANNTAKDVTVRIKNSYEHLSIQPIVGVIPPASEFVGQIFLHCQTVPKRSRGSRKRGDISTIANWSGKFTVDVTETIYNESGGSKESILLSRIVSVNVDARAFEALPSFEALLRSKQRIRYKNKMEFDDIVDTLKTSKRNQSGLYFHKRKVRFGSCEVGELKTTRVFLCNGSPNPITVLLEYPSTTPFTFEYDTTTIQPRHFIAIPISFQPMDAGRYSTVLFAYSLAFQAAVSISGRGV